MNKRFAKIISLMLVLVMVLGVVPGSVFAGPQYNDGTNGFGDLIRNWWEIIVRPLPWYKPTPNYPAQSFGGDDLGGLVVNVEAPAGALPEGTEMYVERVYNTTNIQTAVNNSDLVNGDVIAAVDITFYHNGAEFQPGSDVKVTLSYAGFDGCDDLSVVHIGASAEEVVNEVPFVDPVEDVESDGETVSFDARDFSVYAVIGGGDEDNAILTVKFLDMDGETVINVQKIRKARIPEMDPVVYDPGVPDLGSNQAFTGWGTSVPGASYTTANSSSVEQIEEYILQNYQSWTTEEQLTLTYIAQVFDVTFVFYCDQYGAIFKTETVAVGAEFTYDNSYVADGPAGTTTGLVGWLDYTNVQNSNVNTIGAGSTLPSYKDGAADEASTRVPGGKGTANGEIVLFPYVAGGHWITFESNITYNGNNDPTRATFTAPRFVADGAYASPVDDPVREGYTFGGWYTNAECTTKFNFRNESNPTAVNGNITLYAKWTPNTVSYKIVYWTQNRNDEVDLPNSSRTWDYYAPKASNIVVEGTATAGSTFTLTAADSGKTAYNRLGRNSETYSGNSSNGELGYYFKLNNTMTEKTKLIKGDGTTVFNVYYDRAKLTFNFYNSSSATTPRYTYTGLYEHDFAGYPSPGSGYRWYYDDVNEDETYELSDGTAPSVFKPFLLCSETWDIYRQSYSGYNYNSDIHYMLQDLDGSYYTFRDDTLGYNSSSSYVTMNIGGYEFFGFTGIGYNQTTNSTSTSNGFHGFTPREDKKAYVFNGYQIRTYGTYIYFQRNQWKLDFYSNGTKLTDLSDTVYFDKPLSGYQPSASYVPSNAPVGHYFTGWYKDPECTVPFDWTGKMPNNDMAVYAGWSTEWYRVVFQAYDENVPETAVIVRGENQALSFCMEYGKKIGAGSLANLECSIPGYTFGGWFYDEECTMPFSFDTEIGPNLPDASHNKVDMTYKDWSDSERQGTYHYNKIENGQLVPVSGSWSDVSDATHDNSGVRGYLKLYGLWRKKVAGAAGISVIYDAIEDKGIIRAPYPAEVVKPDPLLYTDGAVAFGRYAATPIDSDGNDDPDRQFLYWEIKDKDGNVVYKVYPGQPFPINIDWAEEVNAYTITWQYKNADGTDASDTTKVAEGAMPRHSAPSSYLVGDTNYVFTGWTPEVVYAESDATYTAQYEAREAVHFTVTFVHNGTTETQQVVEGAYPTVPASVSVPSGKRFIGWYMNDGTTLMSNEDVAATAITAAATFTAQYEDAGYTVTFDANGGYFAADNSTTKVYQNVEAGTKLSDLFPSANPVNDNTVDVNGEAEALSFYAWFTSGTGGTEIDSETVTGDVTVYAHWATRSWEYDNTGTFVVGDMYSFDIMNSSSSQGSGYSLGVGTPGSYLKRSTTTSTVTSDQQWTVFQGSTGTLLANASNGSYYYIYSNDGGGYTSTSQAVAISLASAGTATYDDSTVRVYYLKSGSAYLNYTSSSSYTSWFIWSSNATTKYIVWHYEIVDQNASSKSAEYRTAHTKQVVDERNEVIVPGDEKHSDVIRPNEEKRASDVKSDSELWVPVNTVEAGETYLIGYTDSNTGVTYLMMNYNPAAQAYYTSANLSGYTADRECYAIVAIKDGNGNVTGVDTSSISGATLDHVKWTFNAVSGSTAYNIQSVHNSSYYLRIQNTTATDLRLYPAALNTNYSNWNWDSSNRYLSATYSGVTKYVAVLKNSSTGVITCFDADTDVNYAKGLQLYKKQAVEPTPSGDVQYVLVEEPVNGVSYIIMIAESISGSTGYAVSNANKSGSTDTGTSYALGAQVTVSGDTVTIPASSVNALTWLASGSAASGFTWKNPGTNKYLALTSANYLTAESTTSLVWQYDAATKNMTQAQDTVYPYLGYGSTGSGATNYTVSKNAGAINLYAKAHTLTVNYVFANGGTASETYTAVLGEGVQYSVVSPTLSGYSVSEATVSGSMGDADVTVTVTYTQEATEVYTVTYMANGVQVDTQTVIGGESTATLSNINAPGGYTFSGWVTAQIPTETTAAPTYTAPGANYGPVNADTTLYALFTRVEGGSDTYYELVTSALSNWSGNYVITYGTDTGMYVMKGVTPDSNGATIESSANRSTYAASGIALNGTRLTRVADNYVFTMEPRGSYYSVQSVATGAYLGLTSSSGLLAGYTTYSSTYCRWTPGVGDNASSMKNAYSSASYPYLSFSTNSNYFWSGSSANSGVRLWKETTDSTTYYTTQTEAVYALTINYVVPEGFDAIPSETHYYEEGDAYSITVPEVAHCTPNVTVVEGTMGTQATTVTVTYTEDPKHTVTVHYTGIEGYVLPDAVVTVYEGESYTIGSPYYYGYVADPATVSGVMGTEDLSFTVTYTPTQEQGDKTYTITLYAVYGRANKTGNTHIYWYTNDDSTVFGGGDRQADIAEINTAINIPTPDTFLVNATIDHTNSNGGSKDGQTGFGWEDHVFLGWARVEDPTNTDITGTKHPELDEDDLYLKWTGSGYQVETKNGWVDVTQVAADEMRPYHDMYAVWADVFYVYHSGTGKVEQIVRTAKAGTTFDLANRTSEGYLYGGYYKDYAGKSSNFNEKTMGWTTIRSIDDFTNSMNVQTKDDTGAMAYNGSNAQWDGSKAYKAEDPEGNGLEMKPEAGKTYFIKEVPASMYLQPYLHYTYYKDSANGFPVANAWLISDVDDLCYQETGFIITHESADGVHSARVAAQITIRPANGGNAVLLTPAKIFKAQGVEAGWLSYLAVINNNANQPSGWSNLLHDNDAVLRYWVTPDGLLVTGTVQSVYTGLAKVTTIGKTDTPVTSTIGEYTPNTL